MQVYELINAIIKTSVCRPSIGSVLKYTYQKFDMENSVYCMHCNRVLDGDNTDSLKLHFAVCTPLSFRPAPTALYKCGPCATTETSLKDWTHRHCNSIKHKETCGRTKETLYTYVCSSCEIVLYDRERIIRDHMLAEHDHVAYMPFVCELMSDVYEWSDNKGGAKRQPRRLFFCGPCKKYRPSPVHPDLCCDKSKKPSEPFYCPTCNVVFVCNVQGYVWHLSSVEHAVLLQQSDRTPGIGTDVIPIPRIVLAQFTRYTKLSSVCFMCGKVKSERNLIKHLKKCLDLPTGTPIGDKIVSKIKTFYCDTCDATATTSDGWKNHVLSPEHMTACFDARKYVYYTSQSRSSLFYANAQSVIFSKRIKHKRTGQVVIPFRLCELMNFVFETFEQDPFHEKVFFYYENTGNFGRCDRSAEPDEVPYYCSSCHIEFYSDQLAYDEHSMTCEHIVLLNFIPGYDSRPK